MGFAPSVEVAVAARLVQGAAAGLLTPQNTGLIQELFSGAERGRAFGAFGFTVAVSSAVGPVLGGLIIALFGAEHGWRYIFLVNVPIGVVASFFIARMVPGRRNADERLDLDVRGSLLLGLAVLAILYPLVAAVGGSDWVFLTFALVPFLFWAFFHHEQQVIARGKAPLLDVALLRRTRGFAAGLGIGTIYFIGFTGIFLVLSVSLQEQFKLSPLHTGLVMTAFAAGSAVAAPVGGRLVSSMGRRITVYALALMMIGTAGLAMLVPQGTSVAWTPFVLALLVAGLGGGAVVSPNLTLTLAHVPTRMAGAAGGALQTGQRIGTAVGTALLMSAYRLALERNASPQTALRVSLLLAFVLIGGALVLAVRDSRKE